MQRSRHANAPGPARRGRNPQRAGVAARMPAGSVLVAAT